MTHEEQRVWLIQELLNEQPEYRRYKIPAAEQEQKDLLRALMNIRMPADISQEFEIIQDEYLQEENARAGIVDIENLTPLKCDNRLYLWQGDMTCLKVDAITNPANSGLVGCFRPLHNCVDNIVHTKAGIQLRCTCDRIMKAQGHEEPTGQAKITPGYNLPCKYILHTVGPIVQGHLTKEHEGLLASCYTSCLNLAAENGLESLAFCCISTGVFMFPNQRAAEIAVETVRNWLEETGSQMKVIFKVNYMSKTKKTLIPVVACLAILIAVTGIIGGNLGWFGSKGYTARLANGDSIAYCNGSTGETSFEVEYPISSRELTDTELNAVFPASTESRSAVGTFRDETGDLLRIEGKIGDASVIYAQDGFPVNDVVIEGNETTSSVAGVPVTAGYYITNPNSRGEQLAVFFGSFKIGNTNAYVECFGDKDKADEVSQTTAELIFQIIEKGEPDFSAVTR